MNKLEGRNIDDILALTPMQEGMLFHYLKHPESDLYFEQPGLNLEGDINIEIFKGAWNVVIETNEMLRAVFRWEKVKQPVQIILKQHKVPTHIHDFSDRDNIQKKKALEEIKIKDKQLKFDLHDVPFRVTLCKLGKAEYEVIISNHHILYDGWSLGIILKEFFEAYEALLLDVSPTAAEKTKFRQFIEWSRSRDANKDGEYWKEYLEGFDSGEGFAGKRRKRRGIKSTGNYQIKVPEDLKNSLEEFVKSHNITIASLFYSVWGLLLQQYNSSNDVLFDTTVSGRSAKINGIEDIVGLFINTLPLRVQIHPHEKIPDFLSRTYRMLQQWREFEGSSLLNINEYLDECHRESLFDSVVVIENYPLDKVFMQKNRALSVKSFSISGMTRYDLTVLVTLFDEITLDFTYNKELFDEDITAKLAGDFIYIIKNIIENSQKEISGLMLLSGEVRDKLWERHTSNGLEYEEAAGVYTAPRDFPEERLAGIWAQLYGMNKSEIGIDMNFFDFGGHSLKASLLAAKIHREFNARVPLVEIFRHPTIRELAGYIAQSLEDKYIPIKPTEAKEFYRVSPAQKRLYMLHQLNPGSTVYNGPLIMILEGRVDKKRLDTSFERLIQRHEMLRTSFEQHHGEPVQRIYEENYKFQITNYKQIPNYKLQIPGIIKNFLCPFDLSKAPLLRVGLIKIEEAKHLLMFDMHHIITDGTSRDILTRELTGLYNGEELPSLTIQYKDFSGWQNERPAAGKLKIHEGYWLDHLSGELPVLDMPTDFPRPMMQCFAGERVPFVLDTALARRLHLLMKETGTTLYMVLMSVYSILLGRYGGQDDILVGVPTAGRNHADLQDIVGLFLETMVIRSQPLGDKTFKYFLQEVRHTALKAQEHQDYPFSELVRRVGSAKMNDLSRNPLFDVMLNVLNQNAGDPGMEGVKILPYAFDAKVSKVDITLEAVEKENGAALELEYCTGLFKRETMERFIRHFLNILVEALDNPSIRLADMEIICEEEKRQILEEFNNTAAEYVPGRTVMEYFARQVEKTPDAAAVTCKARVVTYKELNKKSHWLACMLKERGVLADSIVGIMVHRSVEMIIGILGILKAGGAYLPIDPDYPRERIDYMLKDSGAKILLATESTESTEVSSVSSVAFSNLAYIIYTSGSTGRPKGVMVSRKNLAAYIHAFTREFEIKETDVVLQQASFCFDAFVEEVFPCLVSGGTLALPSRDEVRDIALLCRFIVMNKVSIIDCSPLLLNELNRQEGVMSVGSGISPLRTIRTFISGGDVLKGEYIRNLLKIGRVYNTYGPTETTVCAAYHRLNGKEGPNIPIGRPVTGYRVFIVDRDHRLLPIGVTGEICISGVGVTMGYLNRPELTAEKFIKYRSYRSYRTYILYKSGDLGKWLSDGSIEFIGRKDSQVKIRGFRIEPGEIETQLLVHEDINEAAVIPMGENVLCAYFTGRAQKTVKEMRDFLSKKLPGYMIPAYFVRLETFPLGPGGKINTRALPEPVGYGLDSGVEYVPPAGELESRLVELWQELLGLERIGTADDFFDLGGDSILANRCIAAVREKLNVGIPLRQFFERPTIKALAEEIEINKQDRGAGPVSASASSSISIGKAPEGVDIPLSFPQERLWFLQNLDPENKAYFVPRVFRIKGQLEVELLERTFTEIIRRHEILRTVFVAVDGKPVQRIQSPYRFKIPVIDWSSEEGPQQSQEVSRWVREEGRHPFDFEKGPLLRVTLLKLKEHEHLLVLTEHHLVHDGWTQGVLLKEFITIFSAYVDVREHGLPELPIQYADFAYWQRNYLQGEVLANQLNYWKQKLDGVVQVLELPGDRARPPVMSGRGALKDIHLSAALTQQLKDFSRKHGVTLFMTMLAVFKVLLYRYTGTGDLCVGTGIANRSYKEIEGLLGMVINTVSLRTQAAGNITFVMFLHHVKETCLEAYQHQDTPFDRIVEVMDPERSLSYNPLFQVMFSFMDTPTADLRLPGLELRLEPSHNRSSKFDLNIVVVPPVPPDQEREEGGDDAGETLVEWEYNTDIFDDSTMDRMLKHYTRLLEEIINYPGKEISALSMMDEIEINRLLVEWNRTGSEYPRDKTLHELFAEQAARTPDSVSAVGGKEGVHITYGVLNEKAGRLAYFLKEKGVLADSIVGIMVKRSVEMIIGILGILKAGGAYLPIDTEYPQERIDYMLKDSGAKILLTNLSEGCHFHHSSNQFITHHSGNLAYVIYTSGSTGKPKGVMLEHRNVVNFIHGIVSRINFSAGKTILALTTISFDIFVLETLLPLSNGLRVIMVSEEEQKDPRLLARVIVKNRVNMLQVTPSSLKLLLKHDMHLDCLENIDELMVGGESFPKDLFEILKSKYSGRIYNMYGPTETTVWSTVKELTGEAEIAIGIPIANTQIYIIDPYKNLQPVGVVGELCIGGEGLARGYVNRPELTAEKFLSVSYRSYRSYISKKIYKTGDLARWQPGGDIELIGRVDHQVKIRGFRIEAGEIEGVLLKHRDINEAVVVCREDESGDRYLCAYVVPHCREEFREEDVYAYLSESLPGYMVPSYIMILEAMPLNRSGKVDRKSLPGPAIKAGNDYAPPGNEIEVKLVRLWSEILALDEGTVGIDNNFFRLGGHSLKAVGLMNRIHKELSVEVPVSELFKTPTIRGLAGYVRHSRVTPYNSIKPVEKKEYYVLSPAQKRLYILQQMAPDSTGYNLPSVLSLKEDVNRERLEKVIRKLISRHESLRTSFEMKEDEPVQRIHEKNYKFQITNTARNFVRCFDLSKAPLLRVGLIKIEEARHLLMVDMHHIITDDTSREILTGELMSLYSSPGEELSPLPLHYKDYAEWQNSKKQQELIKRQETYWLELFPGDLPVLNLPFDYPRPVLQSFAGSRIYFALDEEETKHLKTIVKENGSTLYIMILSLFSVLLSKLSGEEDIIIGTPVAGRQYPDTEKLIGMFVNTLAMRNYPGGEKTFAEYLEEVKKHTVAAYDNQGYPFEELVEKISVHRDTGRNPVFDVMFNLLNQRGHTGSILLVDEDSDACFERVTAKFDLNLTAIDLEETLSFRLEYCTKLFKKETVERFTRYLREILTSVSGNTGQRIMDMEILPASERMLLLAEFNDTAAQYPKDKTIHELFAEQAARTPDGAAVVGAHENITYHQLNHKSDRLARLLKEKGVLADSIIGIMVKRSVEMITGILGILKAGGAYLPIDPDYPQERIDYMLKDSGAKILLATENTESTEVSSVSSVASSNLAYIIYTSGTTGRPKGVMVQHGNVINLVFGLHRNIYLQYPDNLRVALVSPFVFDASVKQIFAVLLLGHTLCIVGEETRIDSKALKEFYHRYCIDISDGTPIHLHLLVEDSGKVNHMKHFIIGGEALPLQTVKDFFNRSGTPAPGITDVYGPSECCVDSTWYEISKETVDNVQTIPIGKPMPNVQIYIVSQQGQLQPIGVPGELCISGDGVGRGYLNQPELTAEKFVNYRSNKSYRTYNSSKIYKTGDLGRWLADGNIEFLGRIDRQVKIRGFRLELEEIESELLKIPFIKEAVVISRRTAQIPDTLLCAYVVSDETVNPFEIKETLSSRLPGYAVPSTITQIDRIPLTPNGKVNRQELPELRPMKGQEEYVAPTDPIELKMAELWSELLDQDKIGMTDNFFQSGGHSLKAIILISRIRKLLNVHITLADIFTMPTVRSLSGYIRSKEKSPWTSIKPAEEKDYYACTSAQKRLYILQQKDQSGTAYNMPYVVIMEGFLDIDRLEDTFQRLIKRHDSLRTFFEMKEEEPVQRIHRENSKFQIQNYKQIPGSEFQVTNIIKNFVRPFDLSKAPLLRVALIEIEAEKHLLAVDMHHTISDGISRSILVKEFTALYSREELPALHLQYKDYSEWQNSPGQKENISKQQGYWLKQFKGNLPVLALPTDYPRSEVSSSERQTIEFDIEEEDMRSLKKLALEEGTTLYTVLFAVYYVFLSKITGQEDIIVGTPAAGRTHTGLEPLIGMFINTLALRNYPTREKTFQQFLKEVKQNALQAFEYQGYPLEDLVDRVAKDRDFSQNPLFDVMFTLSNVERTQLEIPGLKLTPYSSRVGTAKFDFNFIVHEEERLSITCEYRSSLFKQETIGRFIGYFKDIVHAVLKDNEIKLEDISVSHDLVVARSIELEKDFNF